MTTLTAPLALWLDPEMPLGDADRAAMEAAGWAVRAVPTLADIAAQAAGAAVVIVRLTDAADRLEAVHNALQEAGCSLPVAARVDRHQLELVVEAIRLGAVHVQAAQDTGAGDWQRLRELLKPAPAERKAPAPRNVVFVDPASQHLLALARRVAQAEVTALLVGPTGSGKEVLARVLHEASPRAGGPFVALNCAAMPENLIEDLLFGHEKGAFTGAFKEHKGLFEQAQGGTLFLDEIGEMPMHLQSKLLRVLQERQLTRLGGQTSIALDVRVVAATNKDLRLAIAEREFREDLYYRIATFRMRLLPLAERRGDILPLARHCLAQFSDGRAWAIHPQAQAMLLAYPWPGNVRELENVMRRSMVLCPDAVITPAHLLFDDWLQPLPALAASPAVAVGAATPAAAPSAPFAHSTPAAPPASAFAFPSEAASPTLAAATAATPAAPFAPFAPFAHAAPAAPLASAFAFASEAAGAPLTDAAPASAATAFATAPLATSAFAAPAPAEAFAAPAFAAAPPADLAWQPPAALAGAAEAGRCPATPADLQSATRINEHQIIMATLATTPSRTEAARRLGISPRTLRYKLAQLREMGLSLSPAN